MGKTCLNKLSGNITVGCTINPVGVKNIYLMHAEDVTFAIASTPLRITSVAFASGAKSYLVEGYKQNIQVNGSLKSLDAAASMDASVTFKIPQGAGTSAIDLVNTIAMGRFCVLVLYNDGNQVILGSTIPLECSAADFDSNANAGMVTITLASPEGAAGSRMIRPVDTVRDAIISKSV